MLQSRLSCFPWHHSLTFLIRFCYIYIYIYPSLCLHISIVGSLVSLLLIALVVSKPSSYNRATKEHRDSLVKLTKQTGENFKVSLQGNILNPVLPIDWGIHIAHPSSLSHTHTHTHPPTHARTHARTHTHTHTHTHTQKQTLEGARASHAAKGDQLDP